MNENKTKKKLSKKQWSIISAVLAGICVVCASILIYVQSKNNTKVYDDIRTLAPAADVVPAPPEPTPKPSPTAKASKFTPPPNPGLRVSDRQIDFAKLRERNPDIIGWISVDGTNIDYPIVKSKDNVDYLKTDVDGDENINGSIFMDMFNNADMKDKVTVIYGHNMKNGTMFAALHDFEDEDFFDENREIKIYTPDGMRVYEIVAAYLTDDRNILYDTDFNNRNVYQKYIDSVVNNREAGANILSKEITPEDYILTLSTCERGQDEKRYFVQSVLKTDGPHS